MRFALAMAAAAAFAGSAQAVTIVDGSFEAGGPGGRAMRVSYSALLSAVIRPVKDAGWMTYGSGSGTVDSGIWAASEGDRSIDLSSYDAGGIVQRLSGFTVGRTYRLSFDLSANPFNPAERPRDVRVLASASGETPGIFTYRMTDENSPINMRYQRYFYDFTAIGATQNIRFSRLSNNPFGAVIDNIGLSVVPEAATWAMLIGGFGLVGMAARRRRQAHPSVTA